MIKNSEGVLLVSLSEDESFEKSFDPSCREEYCYSHDLTKDGKVRQEHVYISENTIFFQRVKAIDHGQYKICPSNKRWKGCQLLYLNVKCKL